MFDEETLKDFEIESSEMLDDSENCLLELEKGAEFKPRYDRIFRAFHSIKGGAGMLCQIDLQTHMHQIETHFQSLKNIGSITRPQIDYFLKAVDGCRQIQSGNKINFDYSLFAGSAQKSTTVAAPHSSPQTASSQPTLHTDAKGSKKPIIMIIDDEPEIVSLLTQFLGSIDFDPRGFTDAQEALIELPKIKPSVVFTDLSMPKMDGYAVHKKIRAIDPELPVVFVTGHATKDGLVQAVQYGVFSVIEKPFTLAHITAVANSANARYQTFRLLDKSINLLMYQFSDLDNYLKEKGKEDQRVLLKEELAKLKAQVRELYGQKSS